MSGTSDDKVRSAELVTTRTLDDGITELRLQGEFVSMVIVPEAGGKILQLLDNESGFNVLWQNPRVPVARTYAGAPFDDTWSGGWDDVFPTDESCAAGGNTFHDHGDLWIGPWSWSLEHEDQDRVTVHLVRESVSLPCRFDKWITLERHAREISLHLKMTNLSPAPVRFMWNQHIAHAIGPDSRVHLPVSAMGVVPPAPSLNDAALVTWPVHDGADLSRLGRAEDGVLEFLYSRDLREGWCAVTHPSKGVAVRIDFDKKVFRTPWLWRVFGGWRGHYFLLTEPCTSLPGSLASAIDNDSAATLAGGATLETDVRVTLSRDFDRDAPGDVDPLSTVI